MGAVAARTAAKRAKTKAKVIYTAHGFHFFRGAPLMNWLFFYPVEKYLAHYTDTLITINSEDYNLAVKKKFKVKDGIIRVNGVGVDLKKFTPSTDEIKAKLREEYGYSQDSFMLIYPADIVRGKNQEMIFNAVKSLQEKIPTIRLLLPGHQRMLEEYKQIVKEMGIEDRVDFLGYRRDIHKLVSMCDISVSASRREGLPVNLIEAMAIGKPIIATNVRGNADLVENGKNGYIVELDNWQEMADRICELYTHPETAEKMSKSAVKMAEKYSIENVNHTLSEVYKKYGAVFNC